MDLALSPAVVQPRRITGNSVQNLVRGLNDLFDAITARFFTRWEAHRVPFSLGRFLAPDQSIAPAYIEEKVRMDKALQQTIIPHARAKAVIWGALSNMKYIYVPLMLASLGAFFLLPAATTVLLGFGILPAPVAPLFEALFSWQPWLAFVAPFTAGSIAQYLLIPYMWLTDKLMGEIPMRAVPKMTQKSLINAIQTCGMISSMLKEYSKDSQALGSDRLNAVKLAALDTLWEQVRQIFHCAGLSSLVEIIETQLFSPSYGSSNTQDFRIISSNILSARQQGIAVTYADIFDVGGRDLLDTKITKLEGLINAIDTWHAQTNVLNNEQRARLLEIRKILNSSHIALTSIRSRYQGQMVLPSQYENLLCEISRVQELISQAVSTLDRELVCATQWQHNLSGGFGLNEAQVFLDVGNPQAAVSYFLNPAASTPDQIVARLQDTSWLMQSPQIMKPDSIWAKLTLLFQAGNTRHPHLSIVQDNIPDINAVSPELQQHISVILRSLGNVITAATISGTDFTQLIQAVEQMQNALVSLANPREAGADERIGGKLATSLHTFVNGQVFGWFDRVALSLLNLRTWGSMVGLRKA